MDSQLEEIREIWANAFYSGDYDVLRHPVEQFLQLVVLLLLSESEQFHLGVVKLLHQFVFYFAALANLLT